ncbi:unnamed protein product [Closterium sp. NIES-53]
MPLAECAHFGQHRWPASAAAASKRDPVALAASIVIFDLDFDSILSAMYALSVSAEGDCYRCVPPDQGIAAAALGSTECGTLPGTAPAQALHTFTLDLSASRCFFCDSTTLTRLPAPVPVRLADPSGGPDVARSSTVLPCSAVPSGSLVESVHTHYRASSGSCVCSGVRVKSGSLLRSGATGAEGAGAVGAGVATGATGTGGVGDARARDPTESGAAGAGGSSAGGARAGEAGVGGTGTGGAGVGGTGAGGAGARGAGAFDPRGAVRPFPCFSRFLVPLRHELVSRPVLPIRTASRVPRSRPPPVPGTHAMTLRPSSVPLHVPLPAPPESSLREVPDPESDRARAASPTVSRLLATAVTDPYFESAAASALVAELLDFAAACRLDYASSLVAESASISPPSVGGECALGTDVLEDRREDFECLAAVVPRFASMLLAPEGDPNAPDIPTPRSYAEAITCPYSSQWQAAMDAEMASWKSTCTYVDKVPPLGANIVDNMWIFKVRRLPGSPPAFKARYVARGFSQRQGVDYFHTFSPTLKMTTLRVLLHVAAQRNYELHSLDFSTAFLQGSLHEEIWLCRPPGFIGSFPPGTQTTVVALGFAPSTADPSLFLRIDTSLPPFYVLVYVDDLVFATADTKAVTLVLQHFGFQFSSPQPTPLSTGHSLSAPPLDEFVEPSGLYQKLVGCLMYLMTCTRPDLVYPLSLLARYVAPGRHRKVHWDAAKRVLRYLCSTLTCSSLVLSSSCEAEIYAGAMAAQELRWLTYLLSDLGEQPRLPPQRGQLRLAYVATRANTADIFTKALPPGDHQRFSTVLGLVPTLPHLLTA